MATTLFDETRFIQAIDRLTKQVTRIADAEEARNALLRGDSIDVNVTIEESESEEPETSIEEEDR